MDGMGVSLVHETYLCATFKKNQQEKVIVCFYNLSVVLLDTLELDGVPCLTQLCPWELNLSSYGTALKTIMIVLKIIMK